MPRPVALPCKEGGMALRWGLGFGSTGRGRQQRCCATHGGSATGGAVQQRIAAPAQAAAAHHCRPLSRVSFHPAHAFMAAQC